MAEEKVWFRSTDKKLSFYVTFDNTRQLLEYVVDKHPFEVLDDKRVSLGIYKVSNQQTPNQIVVNKYGAMNVGDTQGGDVVYIERVDVEPV